MTRLSASSRRTLAGGAFAIDALLVLTFAAIGRASHGESNPVTESILTAGPFLVGLVVGWATTLLVRRHAPVDLASGVTVWFATVFVGMVLRVATGRGIAASFVVVAAVVLGVFLLGWRFFAGWITRRRTANP